LDEFAASPKPLDAVASGTFPLEGYAWRMESHDVRGDDPRVSHYRLQEVRLVLTWQSGYGQQSLTVNTRHFGTDRQ
jgi:hypothetical protein